jgi:hypothetical protein
MKKHGEKIQQKNRTAPEALPEDLSRWNRVSVQKNEVTGDWIVK